MNKLRILLFSILALISLVSYGSSFIFKTQLLHKCDYPISDLFMEIDSNNHTIKIYNKDYVWVNSAYSKLKPIIDSRKQKVIITQFKMIRKNGDECTAQMDIYDNGEIILGNYDGRYCLNTKEADLSYNKRVFQQLYSSLMGE